MRRLGNNVETPPLAGDNSIDLGIQCIVFLFNRKKIYQDVCIPKLNRHAACAKRMGRVGVVPQAQGNVAEILQRVLQKKWKAKHSLVGHSEVMIHVCVCVCA